MFLKNMLSSIRELRHSQPWAALITAARRDHPVPAAARDAPHTISRCGGARCLTSVSHRKLSDELSCPSTSINRADRTTSLLMCCRDAEDVHTRVVYRSGTPILTLLHHGKDDVFVEGIRLNIYPSHPIPKKGDHTDLCNYRPIAITSLLSKVTDVKVFPLLLMHGWPGSVREFFEVIPRLTEKAPGYDFVFELIIPSLPGYGFSDMITDLKYRLRNYRPPAPPLQGVSFEYGFNSQQLDHWLKYWAEEYPFKERESFLNQFPQYKTNIQGLDVHFIRVSPKNAGSKAVVPLLILHGWPGSVREFYEVIPFLAENVHREDRDFAVDVIVPSLPGYGFSDAAVRPGFGVDKAAVVFRNLMHRLGYQRYYIQGGDMGAFITSNMATFFPDEILGYHTNAVFTQTTLLGTLKILGAVYPPLVVRADLADRLYPLSKILHKLITESGYFHLQATKPDTVGAGLSDSPSGLAAYILEKFSTGTRYTNVLAPDGGLLEFYTKDQLIDNLMMYWTSNCMSTAVRWYAETFNRRYYSLNIDSIKTPVPTWVIQAKDDIVYLPPWMLRFKYPNLLNETALSRGGHFLALEQPIFFAENVLDAITEFRKWHVRNSNKVQ